MPFGWEPSELSMGGGINCIGLSDDGLVGLAGGDISGTFRSLRASDLKDWSGANRGGYDGGQHGAHGGVIFRAGSHDDALKLNKAGLWITRNASTLCEWELLSGAASFGEGGGEYPRNNVGHIADSAGNFTYFVRGSTGSAILGRYNWATGALNMNVATITGVVGEGVAADPEVVGHVLVAARNGLYRVTGADGASPTVGRFNGTGAPAVGGAVVIEVHPVSGAKWVFCADGNTGVKGLQATPGQPFAQAAAWQNKTGGTMTAGGSADYVAIDAVGIGTANFRVLVGIANPTRAGGGRWRSAYLTDNGQAASPTWVCISEDNANMTLLRQGGAVRQWDGRKAWVYLPFAEGGGNGQNCFAEDASASFDCSDVRLNRANPNEGFISGRNGITRLEFDTRQAGPVNDLGVTANGPVVCDQDSRERVFVLNTDHVVEGMVAAYGDEQWLKNENYAGSGGEVAGFDLDLENGHVFEVMGPRTLAGAGNRMLYHPDPIGRPDKDHGIVGFTWGGTPYGCKVYRASDGGTQRRFVFVAVEGVGFQRGKLNTDGGLGSGSTCVPPTVNQQLQTISGSPALVASNQDNEWAQIVRITDDILVAQAPKLGLYLIRNARGTPTMHRIWNYGAVNDARGRGGIAAGLDGDSVFVSIYGGADRGVYKLTGLSTADGSDTVENSGITDVAISKPSGAWRAPGPISCRLVNGVLRVAVIDGSLNSGATPTAPPQCLVSTNPAGTTLTDISGPRFGDLVIKWYSIDQDPSGRIYVSCQGPGVAQYVDDADVPPDPPAEIDVINTDAHVASTTATGLVESGEFTSITGERVAAIVFSSDGDGADLPEIADDIGVAGDWELQVSQTIQGGAKRISIYDAVVGAGATGTVTATFSDNQTGAGIVLARVAGSLGPRQSRGATGSGALRQVALDPLSESARSAVIGASIRAGGSPSSGIVLGSWPSSNAQFDAIETAMGHEFAYFRGRQLDGQFDTELVMPNTADRADEGYQVGLNIQPKFGSGGQRTGIRYPEIRDDLLAGSGVYFDWIMDGIDQVKALPTYGVVPIYMQFHSEASFQAEPGVPDAQPFSGSGAEYRELFPLIRALYTAEDADDGVFWIMVHSRGTYAGNNGGPDNWYPADHSLYDFVGCDAYYRPDTWHSAAQMFDAALAYAIEHDKPLWIDETGWDEGGPNNTAGAKAAAIAQLATWLETNRARMAGVVFSHAGDGGNWYLDSVLSGGRSSPAFSGQTWTAWLAQIGNNPIFESGAGSGAIEPSPGDLLLAAVGYEEPPTGVLASYREQTTDPVWRVTGGVEEWGAVAIEYAIDEATGTDDRAAIVTWVEMRVPDPVEEPEPDPESTLTGQDPESGPEGTVVTLEGTNLQTASSVKLNGLEVEDFTAGEFAIVTAVPVGATDGVWTVVTALGTVVSDFSFNVTATPTPGGGDIPSGGNPTDTLTLDIVGIWIVDRDFGTPDDPAVKIQLLEWEDLPSELAESSEALIGIGNPRVLRINDGLRGYEGTVSGLLTSMESREILESWRRAGGRYRLIASDLNIPVQMSAFNIGRIPTAQGYYPVSFHVEQIDEFDR